MADAAAAAAAASSAPTDIDIDIDSDPMEAAELAEEEHVVNALSLLGLNVTVIICLMIAYAVKRFRIYVLPESAGAILVGMVIGGIARFTTEGTHLFEFSPEVFFFVVLPPIIFEAGYSLDKSGFFTNIGAITLYAMAGTIISTFCVGILCFYVAKVGLIRDIDRENPMEALLFGALISAVDPVATLSIMGNPELNCDPLLYSLVFGESVLNDAVAIVLFKTLIKYYDPSGPDWSESEIPAALLSFFNVSFFSILVGVALGLVASWMYKHTSLSDYPTYETALLFCFCYLCYSTAEAVGLSGIMALFFHGIILSHFNSYNLSAEAHVSSEQIFSTLAVVMELVVYISMGCSVFTARFEKFDILFSVLALAFCLVGRFFNIFPLSWIANLCRRGQNKITPQMQTVLWFAGLRGAIAFALSESMPGPNADVYSTATLSICIFTTVVCGGFTEKVLTMFEMKNESPTNDDDDTVESMNLNRVSYTPSAPRRQSMYTEMARRKVYEGMKGVWNSMDDHLRIHFGGPERTTTNGTQGHDDRREYELAPRVGSEDSEDETSTRDDDDHDQTNGHHDPLGGQNVMFER